MVFPVVFPVALDGRDPPAGVAAGAVTGVADVPPADDMSPVVVAGLELMALNMVLPVSVASTVFGAEAVAGVALDRVNVMPPTVTVVCPVAKAVAAAAAKLLELAAAAVAGAAMGAVNADNAVGRAAGATNVGVSPVNPARVAVVATVTGGAVVTGALTAVFTAWSMEVLIS